MDASLYTQSWQTENEEFPEIGTFPNRPDQAQGRINDLNFFFSLKPKKAKNQESIDEKRARTSTGECRIQYIDICRG